MISYNSIKNKIKSFLEKSFALTSNVVAKLKSFIKTFSKKDQFEQPISHELDKKLVLSLSKSKIPTLKQLKHVKKFLNKKELWTIRVSALVIICSLSFLGVRFYLTHLQITPAKGGSYSEGLIGAPKYINPLYSNVNDVDSDLSKLIYSSLFKYGKNGELEKDLVDNYEISDDKKIYTFTIKQGVEWHKGSGLTAQYLTVDDIIFTFNAIKDKQYKSPLRTSFTGVEIEKVDDNSFKLILADPYVAFLNLLTFGILPAEIWSQIPYESVFLAELNKTPIGSGPYKFDKFVKDKNGHIKEYDLVANETYYGQKPYINNINFKFFPDFHEAIVALNDGTIDGISYLPRDLKAEILIPKALNYNKLYIPQTTILFLNQKSNPALADKSVRQALAYALDRNELIMNVLGGDAFMVDSPILPNSFAYNKDAKKYDYNLAEANKLLDNVDWKIKEVTEEEIKKAEQENLGEGQIDEKTREKNDQLLKVGAGKWREKNGKFLVVKLTTIDRNENEQVVNAIKEYWEKTGTKVEVEILPANQIQSDTIKNKNFEVLFYGQVLGADPDPYAFWHSSQSVQNGYNIVDFSNKEVDELLEDGRLIFDEAGRQEKYKKFQDIFAEELPAIFVYSPVYIYVQNKNLKGFDVKNILTPSDRFANVNEWYIKTGKKLTWD